MSVPRPDAGLRSGQASVVIEAANQDRPLLGSDQESIGWTEGHFGLGRITAMEDRVVLAVALADGLETSEMRGTSESRRQWATQKVGQ